MGFGEKKRRFITEILIIEIEVNSVQGVAQKKVLKL